MRIALCNEVLSDRPFAAQCALARELGYDGLEVAPFTLAGHPDLIDDATTATILRTARDEGIVITGLHWLLVHPEALSITSTDAAIRTRTVTVMRRLIELCAALGGSYLVHGSPAQRRVPPGDTAQDAWSRARDCFAQAGVLAQRSGVRYLIEPLPRDETDLINTLDEAAAMLRDAGGTGLGLVLDAKSVALSEGVTVEAAAARWLPTGLLGHVQLNDRNRRGPGQGDDRFAGLLATLQSHGYGGDIAIEPFDYHPDRATQAARAIGYVRGILEGLASRQEQR